ncbi:MAG: alpha-L-fucosidase [Cyclobacteriaceae bacterium]
MKNRITYITFALLMMHSVLSKGQEKLKRSESFFGFHFDFHATQNDKELGGNFDEDLLHDFLLRTKPDYIQIDSKGHPGYSSYPTQVGFSANSFVKDPMRIWRDITAKHNVPLYVHYSGIWDARAIAEYPEWGRINSDGSKDSTKAAYLSDYAAKLLIPQLKEMIDVYDIDGAWVDGDCWATAPDYSPEVMKGFIQETKIKEVPRKTTDPGYKEWLDYNRLVYRRYMKNYIDELHQYKPEFQIASNWAYSSVMPEKVDVAVDFLSGDVSGQNGVYSAAFQARCLALQGKPWDLMAWGFAPIDFMGGIHSPKSLVQLQQEAAEVMAMGGGFQVYFQQNRDASFRTLDTEAMVKLANFCRERQPFCQYSEVVPQIGMWYSQEGWKKHFNGVYGGGGYANMEGIANMLLDGQHSVEILMDHKMKELMQKYPLIVIPEWEAFDKEIKEQLLDYVETGGNVLVIGAKTVKEFEPLLAVTLMGEDTTTQINIGDKGLGGIAGIKTQWQPVISNAGTEEIGHVYSQRDYRYATDYPVATINNYGKGNIAALYLDMSAAYNTYRNPVFNELINQLIERLFPDATLKVKGSDQVHVVLGKKGGNILVHLINSSGEHFNRNVLAYNELRLTPPLTINLKVEEKPKAVKLQPMNKILDFEYRNNRIELMIPPVEVHSIIEVVQ